MAATFHISEAEAARDLSALVDRALAGEEIVLRRGTEDVVMLSRVRGTASSMRSLGEVIELLKQRRETHGAATIDDEFASDMENIHNELNRPVDGSSWD